MIRRPPRSTQGVSSAASDVYKRQLEQRGGDGAGRAGADDHDLTGFHFNDWHVSSGTEAVADSKARDAGRSGPVAASRSGPSASARSTAPG